jgi:hypothetical protein
MLAPSSKLRLRASDVTVTNTDQELLHLLLALKYSEDELEYSKPMIAGMRLVLLSLSMVCAVCCLRSALLLFFLCFCAHLYHQPFNLSLSSREVSF